MSRKLDCRFRKRLNAYLDNELDKEEFIQIKDHLLGCPECQNDIRELNSINEFLCSYKEEDVPDNIIENLSVLLTDIPESRIYRRNKLINFTIAASVAASFLIGIIFSNITFTDKADSYAEFDLGQESLYSYYIGE